METLIGGAASFIFFHVISHPKSKIGSRVPRAKIKRVQFLPNLRIEFKNKIFHLHHWMWITPFYIAAHTLETGFLKSGIVQGVLMGGIVQGLLFKDSLRFLYPATEVFQKQGYSQYPLRLIRKFI